MSENLVFRLATREDLPAIVRMLADDKLGRQRERYADPLPDAYYAAFDRIEEATGNELIVATRDGRIVGSMQLTWIPSISFQGGMRLLIESVRVDSPVRGQGSARRCSAGRSRKRAGASASWSSSPPTTSARRHCASTNASASRPVTSG